MLKIAAVILAILVSRSAFAFSEDEHVYVSNLALRIALLRAHGLNPVTREQLANFTSREKHTFGDIVALADHIKDEAPLFDAVAHQNPESIDAVDWAHFERLRKETLRSLQAKSLNENHFQSLALSTHLAAHHAAIGEARANRWLRALLFEAYALHHIEDFLSPGHVATARAGMADFVAIGLHDKYTDRGLKFRFDRNKKLIAIAEDVAKILPEYLFRHVTTDVKLVLGRQDFEALATAMANPDVAQHFLGDSHLHQRKIQAAFITAVAVLSIEEVLSNHDEDAFADYCWQWRGRTSRDCTNRPHKDRSWSVLGAAQIPGGGYDDVVHPVQFFVPGEVLFLTLHNAVNPDEDVNNREGGQVGRRFLEAEALVVAIPQVSKRPIASILAPSLLVGYRRAVGPGSSSQAAQLRVIVPIPRTNLQLSYARSIQLGGRGDRSEGAILEAGFGFIFARVGAQRDTEARPAIPGGLHGGASRTTVYTFGMSGIVPGRTALHWVKGLGS